MNDGYDDLASAWLDGELGDDELASVDDLEALRLARDDLSRARAALARDVPRPPAGLADAQIARAVEALAQHGPVDREADVAAVDGEPATVVPLRRRPSSRSSWLSRVAVVVLVAGGATAAVVGLDSGRERPADDLAMVTDTDPDGGDAASTGEAAEVAPEAEELRPLQGAGDGGDAAGSAPSADDGAEAPAGGGATESTAADASPLSPVATSLVAERPLSAPELAAELADRFGPAAGWPVGDGASSCADGTPATGGVPPAAVVPFERDGEPVALLVPADGEPRYVDPASCAPLG